MAALHDIVRAGKARYIGASSMYAWEFAKAQYTARAAGWTSFVSMQNHYNLVYREEEREMIPLCLDEGVGVCRGARSPAACSRGAGRATARRPRSGLEAIPSPRCTRNPTSTSWTSFARSPTREACRPRRSRSPGSASRR